ncbi:tetratricopeptide repeat protein [Rheinheimera oceanensis]|uniref:tetratricopeptide repeat protein n=1 Tax=Rheinheimera oceanensis TaxID=2817449 RepID=UPI001BFD867A|nr:tetratricopeptide repeat protein [Rheinheimera oceanensis]
MIRSVFFILSLFIANLAVAEDGEKFSAAQQAFYSGDYRTAKTVFLQAAEQGSAEAEYFLGLIAKNDVDSADYLAAKSHFTNAAQLNHAQAMWELGVLYENGEGVEQNQFIALDWFRKSELAGGTVVPDSFYVNDHTGELNEVSVSQYLEYLTQQAQSGRTDAKFALAKIYDTGVVIAANLPQAFNWYLSAAKDGHVKAAQLVSYFYCRGIAVPRNPEQANAWVEASGYSTSCD